jgi:tyrosinase
MSRRSFLAAAAGLGISARAAFACDQRPWQPVLPSRKGNSNRRLAFEPIIRIRPNIASLNDQQLDSLRRGVAAMKALPSSDRRSWTFQAAIHGTTDSGAVDPLFNQCQHGTLYFLPWHRGYLHFFERILRWAANDPDLMLPFWDWTNQPVLPDPFRSPADASNSLYEPRRKANDGSEIPSSVVVDDLNFALGQTSFPGSNQDGFSPDLEGSPHGLVHTTVGGRGGLMSSVPTAAGDPIFWLHHTNIDRLWNVWLNQNEGRANPADPDYLSTAYSFADETGAVVMVQVRDIISSAALNYAYEGVPNPPAPLFVAEPKPPSPRVVATSAPPEKHDTALEKVEAKPLGFEEKRVSLNVVKENRAFLAKPLPAPAPKSPRIRVVIEGLSAAEAPDFVYRVYVNLPEGERSEQVLRQHYIGSINFFGKTQADKRALGHQHGAGTEFNATFDATRVVAALQQSGRFDPDALTVTILPAAPIPPGADPNQVGTRAEATAKQAKVAYKRVSILVSGGD